MARKIHSLYREIFKKAFFITWRNKYLWLMGLFTTFLGVGGLYEATLKNSLVQTNILDKLQYKTAIVTLYGSIIGQNIGNLSFLKILGLILAGLIILALFIASLWIGISSFGGLIFAANHIDGHKKTTFKKSFLRGHSYFWPLLWINLLGKLLIFTFLSLTAVAISYLLNKANILISIIFLLLFIIFVAFSIIVSFLVLYASANVILKNEKTFASIKNSWKIFINNWVVSIESGAILFLINVIIKIGAVTSIVILSVPFMILLMLVFYANLAILSNTIIMLWLFSGLLAILFSSALYSSYNIVAWTLIFDKIAKGGILSKLHRVFKK